jgi:hypothetical protein
MNLDNFRSAFRGGTRQNRFRVSGDIFTEAGGESDMKQITGSPNGNLLIKAAQFPPSTLGIIPVPFRGRIAKVVGDRQYMEWPIVIYDTTDATYRRFQEWSEAANRHVSNNQPFVWDDTKNVLTKWTVEHLSSKGDVSGANYDDAGTEVLKTVELVNCWPVEIGSIDLSYDAMDTVVEFPVTIAYDYFQMVSPNPPSPGSSNT